MGRVATAFTLSTPGYFCVGTCGRGPPSHLPASLVSHSAGSRGTRRTTDCVITWQAKGRTRGVRGRGECVAGCSLHVLCGTPTPTQLTTATTSTVTSARPGTARGAVRPQITVPTRATAGAHNDIGKLGGRGNGGGLGGMEGEGCCSQRTECSDSPRTQTPGTQWTETATARPAAPAPASDACTARLRQDPRRRCC